MKKKGKWLAGCILLFAFVLLLCVPFIRRQEAQAFTNGYTTTDENALQFLVKQKKASSSATVKYKTGSWYLFKEKLGGSETTLFSYCSRDVKNICFSSKTAKPSRLFI